MGVIMVSEVCLPIMCEKPYIDLFFICYLLISLPFFCYILT